MFMEAALLVENLRAYYLMRYFGVVREVRAVDDISLEVRTNEIYGLAGESSSGKTTFIKTIAAAIRPPLEVVGGSIKYGFLDRDIYDLSPRALAAIRWKHLSYVTQGSMNVLNPIRRVRQSFIDFAFRHIGRSKKRDFFEIVDRHLARLHLAPTVLNAYPHELSGGMRQRVAIALATICRPALSTRMSRTDSASCTPVALWRRRRRRRSSTNRCIPTLPILSQVCRESAMRRQEKRFRGRRRAWPIRRAAAGFTHVVPSPRTSAVKPIRRSRRWRPTTVSPVMRRVPSSNRAQNQRPRPP
jgi:ABC-type dipeptide/oligopeptide/nickel transport system ATPase subunit